MRSTLGRVRTGTAALARRGEATPVWRFVASPFVHAPLAAAILVLLTVGGGLSPYHSFLVTITLVYIVATLGLNISAGYLGQLSLGQGAAFGVGAYTAAILTVDHAWPVAATLVAALAVGAVLGILIAAPAARLGLIGVAMVSLGATLVLTDAIVALPDLTGGTAGRYGIAAPLFTGDTPLDGDGITLVVIATVVVTYLLHWGYRVSNAGRASLAIRGNAVGAAGLGIPSYFYKVLGFALGTGIGAMAGALYAYLQSVVSPEQFTAHLSILFLLMVLLGGSGTRVGPLIGGAVIGLLPIFLSKHPNIHHYVYGALLLLLVRVLPRGIVFRRGAGVPRGRLGGRRPVSAPAPAAAGGETPRAAPGETCLALEAVGRHFGGVYAVQDVSIEVPRGEVLAIVGPNGSGKTTVLNLISGFYRPHAGRVVLNGEVVNGVAPHRIAARGVARTFQVPQLFPDLTVAEHLALARHYTGRRREDLHAAAESFLAAHGFTGASLAREAREFAHGQQRFLEVCMALLRSPDLLLLDEPAAGLSHDEIARLQEVVERASELGVTVLVVEHHHDFVRNIADRVLVMHLGRAVWVGPPEEFGTSKDVQRAYLQIAPTLTEAT